MDSTSARQEFAQLADQRIIPQNLATGNFCPICFIDILSITTKFQDHEFKSVNISGRFGLIKYTNLPHCSKCASVFIVCKLEHFLHCLKSVTGRQNYSLAFL